ncbi:MAG: acyl-CoA dehydrogenase, partial [Ilumatobacteraceae bacterium]
MATIAMAADVIAAHGTAAQIDSLVRPAIEGERVLTAAVAEPFNREPSSPTTTATRDGDGWRLAGTKTSVPAATIADAIVVTASADGRPALFIVEPGAAGLTITAQDTTNKEPYGYIELDGVAVAADAVVGDVAAGAEAIERLLLRSTVGLCATQLGVTEEGLRATAEYTKERVQFERPIATFQAVGHRCADAYIDVEGIRLSLWQAIENLETDDDEAPVAVQTAKFWSSDGGHRVAHAIVHLHGGMGIATEYFIHRYFAFAKQIEFSLGGATEQALRIGG